MCESKGGIYSMLDMTRVDVDAQTGMALNIEAHCYYEATYGQQLS